MIHTQVRYFVEVQSFGPNSPWVRQRRSFPTVSEANSQAARLSRGNHDVRVVQVVTTILPKAGRGWDAYRQHVSTPAEPAGTGPVSVMDTPRSISTAVKYYLETQLAPDRPWIRRPRSYSSAQEARDSIRHLVPGYRRRGRPIPRAAHVVQKVESVLVWDPLKQEKRGRPRGAGLPRQRPPVTVARYDTVRAGRRIETVDMESKIL